MEQSVTRSKRGQVCDEDREEENDRYITLIQTKSHFNFILMHLLSHFRDYIRQFGNIQMYSTEYGELAHKDQIKDGWLISNENDPERQIINSYGRLHKIRMRLLTLNSLRRRGADLPADILEYLDPMSMDTAPAPHCRILKGRRADVTDVMNLGKVMEVSAESYYHELIRYTRHSLPSEHRLPEHPARHQSLPVELITHLEVTVPAFQETEVYDINRSCWMGNRLLRNQGSRNDWVCVHAGGEGMYGALSGGLPAKLMALFKIRDYISE